MTIKENTTGRGGNVGYKMVRSKFVKGKDGYGKVITAAREQLLKSNGGKDPGPDVVAAHKNFGAHHGDDQISKWKSRAWNTAESNMHRKDGISATDKMRLKKYKGEQEAKPKKSATEKLDARRAKR